MLKRSVIAQLYRFRRKTGEIMHRSAANNSAGTCTRFPGFLHAPYTLFFNSFSHLASTERCQSSIIHSLPGLNIWRKRP